MWGWLTHINWSIHDPGNPAKYFLCAARNIHIFVLFGHKHTKYITHMLSSSHFSIILALASGLWLSHAQAAAPRETSEFNFNGQILRVPNPENFVRVTSENMPQLYRFSQQLSDPMNDTLAYYVPTGTLDGEPEKEVKESFILKINKNLRNVTFPSTEFEQLKSDMAANNHKIFQEIQQKVEP